MRKATAGTSLRAFRYLSVVLANGGTPVRQILPEALGCAPVIQQPASQPEA
jgi:hypothetical protein